MEQYKLSVASSPHASSPFGTKNLMRDVLIALVPAMVMGVWVFGPRALTMTLVSVLACEIFEWGYCKLMHKPNPIGDLSAAITGVLLVLAARSGDTAGGISAVETAFRSWLEYTFYVRPRTKELLFAVPCIPVFLWACRRNCPPLQLLCGMGVCLECVSVINTFCHAVAPLTVSLARTLLAVGAGLVPGILALLALEGFYRLRTR